MEGRIRFVEVTPPILFTCILRLLLPMRCSCDDERMVFFVVDIRLFYFVQNVVYFFLVSLLIAVEHGESCTSPMSGLRIFGPLSPWT